MIIRLTEAQFDLLAKKFLLSNANDALAGKVNNQSILMLVREAISIIGNRQPFPDSLRNWLLNCFLKTVKEEDANKGFGLSPAHRPKNDAGEERTIALAVWKRIHIDEEKVGNSIREIAATKIEGKYRGYDAISNIYKKYKEEITKEALAILETAPSFIE
ncbi:MAG TPA: hypothetical protein VLH77_02840 [Gammaproteobacteria bacterium]|nr:hypothetical protein [Gammaproteobacteria bacterium]